MAPADTDLELTSEEAIGAEEESDLEGAVKGSSGPEFETYREDKPNSNKDADTPGDEKGKKNEVKPKTKGS